MDEAQIKAVTERFLSYKLPADFNPDGGITFTPEFNVEHMAAQGKPPMRHEPTGTNLLNYDQARDLVIHLIGWGGWRLGEAPDLMADIEAFHVKFGLGYEGLPRMLPTDLHDFRHKFHLEEIEEYDTEHYTLREIAGCDNPERDHPGRIVEALENQLDALVDAVYVILGTAYLQFGRLRFNEAWKRVQVANMAKERKLAASDGHTDSGRAPKYDVVKPPGWTAPSHADLVQEHEPVTAESV